MSIDSKQKHNNSLNNKITDLEEKIKIEERQLEKYKNCLSSYGYSYEDCKNKKYDIAKKSTEVYFILCDIESVEYLIDKYKSDINTMKNKIEKNSDDIHRLSIETKLKADMSEFFINYEKKLSSFIGDSKYAHKSVSELYIKIVNAVGDIKSTSEVAFNGCEMYGIIRGTKGDAKISSVLIPGNKKMKRHYRYSVESISHE